MKEYTPLINGIDWRCALLLVAGKWDCPAKWKLRTTWHRSLECQGQEAGPEPRYPWERRPEEKEGRMSSFCSSPPRRMLLELNIRLSWNYPGFSKSLRFHHVPFSFLPTFFNVWQYAQLWFLEKFMPNFCPLHLFIWLGFFRSAVMLNVSLPGFWNKEWLLSGSENPPMIYLLARSVDFIL